MPVEPALNFYDWIKHIHGHIPNHIRQNFDENGNRRGPKQKREQFEKVIQDFKNSLLKS